MTPTLFHSTLSSLWDPENHKPSFTFIFRTIDNEFLHVGKFEECDVLLRHPLTLLMHDKLKVALLMITNLHKDVLPSRFKLVDSTIASLTAEFGEKEARAIMGSLP